MKAPLLALSALLRRATAEMTSNREKHNCRKCGLLVCDPCSRSRKPLPQIGLNSPVRICDRCRWSTTTTTRGGAGATDRGGAGAAAARHRPDGRAPQGGSGSDAAPSEARPAVAATAGVSA
jgi:hypothetical protein